MEFYLHFNLPMDRSPGFGSIARNFIRPIQTRSRFASGTEYLKLATYNNSPDHSTKGTTSRINALCVLVSTRFQVLFHSPPGVLFTFPSRYCSSIGHQVVFRVGGWSPQLPTGFHVSCGTLDPGSSDLDFAYGTITRCGWLSHAIQLSISDHLPVLNPGE